MVSVNITSKQPKCVYHFGVILRIYLYFIYQYTVKVVSALHSLFTVIPTTVPLLLHSQLTFTDPCMALSQEKGLVMQLCISRQPTLLTVTLQNDTVISSLYTMAVVFLPQASLEGKFPFIVHLLCT